MDEWNDGIQHYQIIINLVHPGPKFRGFEYYSN